jgi:hypothetical protein
MGWRSREDITPEGDALPVRKSEILALGLCPTCYTLKRQDDEYYGGLREAVLDRDERRCRTCPNLKRQKLAVHHRVPGVSKLELMITLCLGCHAKVTRTQFLQDDWPELLRILWREQHPAGHEQPTLNFRSAIPLLLTEPLFNDEEICRLVGGKTSR